jgi:hypothetical protein
LKTSIAWADSRLPRTPIRRRLRSGGRIPSSPIDGIEWINADSEWRDETRGTLVKAGLAYFLRGAGALGELLDRPATLDRWNALSSADASSRSPPPMPHGGPGQRAEDQGRTMFGTVGIPSYEASFRALSNRVILQSR